MKVGGVALRFFDERNLEIWNLEIWQIRDAVMVL